MTPSVCLGTSPLCFPAPVCMMRGRVNLWCCASSPCRGWRCAAVVAHFGHSSQRDAQVAFRGAQLGVLVEVILVRAEVFDEIVGRGCCRVGHARGRRACAGRRRRRARGRGARAGRRRLRAVHKGNFERIGELPSTAAARACRANNGGAGSRRTGIAHLELVVVSVSNHIVTVAVHRR